MEESFESYRSYLFSIAYRMLGSADRQRCSCSPSRGELSLERTTTLEEEAAFLNVWPDYS